MIEVIKTTRIGEKFNLTLVYFYSTKGYEVQYSDDDFILDTDGIYNTKIDGIKVFNKWLQELVEEQI